MTAKGMVLAIQTPLELVSLRAFARIRDLQEVQLLTFLMTRAHSALSFISHSRDCFSALHCSILNQV